MEDLTMTEKEFKAYLDMVVEKAFKEGVRYERDRVKFGRQEDWISVELAVTNAQANILGD
jgi:hypothetical protein